MVRELKRRGVPMLMLYGERDKLIDREVSEEMAAMMGVQPTHMHVFQGKDDAEAVRVQTGEPAPYICDSRCVWSTLFFFLLLFPLLHLLPPPSSSITFFFNHPHLALSSS